MNLDQLMSVCAAFINLGTESAKVSDSSDWEEESGY